MLTYAQGIAPARKNMILLPITSFFFLAGASPCGLIMRVMQSTLILKKLKPTFFLKGEGEYAGHGSAFKFCLQYET